jgi:membrane protease YdiL (CAAX protease family)
VVQVLKELSTKRVAAATVLRPPVEPARRSVRKAPLASPVSPDQHSVGRSIVLHLMPGAALLAFVVVAAAVGIPAVVALLAGIGVVIVPIELGYLLLQARRKSGRWSLSEVVDYREPMPARRVALWTIPLVAWFIVLLMLSVGVLDQRIADSVFSWYPESIREFASTDEDTSYATWILVVFFAAAFAVNGVIGPVVEELYFRGNLLPRIDRFGRGAPVLNAVLFSLYHFWTPWQNPGRILALLPWIYTVWGKRSLRLSIAVHISVNCIFLLLVVAAISSS